MVEIRSMRQLQGIVILGQVSGDHMGVRWIALSPTWLFQYYSITHYNRIFQMCNNMQHEFHSIPTSGGSRTSFFCFGGRERYYFFQGRSSGLLDDLFFFLLSIFSWIFKQKKNLLKHIFIFKYISCCFWNSEHDPHAPSPVEPSLLLTFVDQL